MAVDVERHEAGVAPSQPTATNSCGRSFEQRASSRSRPPRLDQRGVEPEAATPAHVATLDRCRGVATWAMSVGPTRDGGAVGAM